METQVFHKESELPRAAEALRAGELVAVPTETVYGLCANGLDAAAVAALYEVKGRPEVKPLSLMVGGPEDMERYARDIPAAAYTLAGRFWPGPLTLVLKAKELVPSIVRAGGATVGLRCPDHPLTLALLRQLGAPLAGPSANPSGAPSPKTAEAVLGYFDGRIAAVVDGGACGIGRESTILDLTATPYRVLRPGALSMEAIGGCLVDGMRIIGLTGGTGTGKTTVLRELERRGLLALDCDEIYHELLGSCVPMLRELEQRFPAAFGPEGLDRKALGRIVFADPAELRELNDISHRYVKEELRRRLLDHALRGGQGAVIDAIALFESGLSRLCGLTVGVTAPREIRLARIMAREGISEDYARARIDAQHGDEWFRAHCDAVIENDATLDDLKEKIHKILDI
ncbi:MAG: threonylcarbamoyl-AMP synthase [Oscillospiraceae bacterium]|nr:threonylcarbamoyl-AMP synthase [Oscillospiraceae bacterium]